MTEGGRSIPCATCGKLVDAFRAPRVRFSTHERWVFCCEEHGDSFVVPSPRAAVVQGKAQSPKSPRAAQRTPDHADPVASELDRGSADAEKVETQTEPRAPLETREEGEGAEASLWALDYNLTPSSLVPQTETPEPRPVPSEEADNADSHAEPGSDGVPPRSVHEPVSLPLPEVVFGARPSRSPAIPAATVASTPEAERDAVIASTRSRSPTFAGRGGEFGWVTLQYFPVVVLLATIVGSVVQGRPVFAQAASAVLLLSILVWERRTLAPATQLDWPEGLRSHGAQLVHIKQPEGAVLKDASQLKAGEEIVVEPGDFVHVDGVVSAGQARVIPWYGSAESVDVQTGARLVAGAVVESGSLHIVATKTAARRAFHFPSAFLREHVVLVWAGWSSLLLGPAIGGMTGLLVYLQSHDWLASLSATAAGSGGFMSRAGGQILRSLVIRAWAAAAQRGIAYGNASLFEHAGQVSSVVFNARGTVLYGEPDVAEIHVFRGGSEGQVLALAAGAESAVHHPIASSTLRAAHHRSVQVDRCRGHHVINGLGVLCSSSDGRSVVVGSRELLLRERVSVAIAEEQLRTLETRGMSTLLVALDGRLIGILGLQDSLRAGARATFQLLLDHHIEPILLSGDARATTEAVAQALSCEHIRPEVPALSRAAEVRSLIEAGLTVAVIGNSPRDDVALGAAQVPIILEGASVIRADSPHSHERGIGIASDRVVDAAVALLLARRARLLLLQGLGAWLVLTVLGALLVMSQLVPLFIAPLLSLVGLLLAYFRAKRFSMDAYPP